MKYYNLPKFAILLCLTLLSHFIFGQAPLITGASPYSGCYLSGNRVVIKGKNFINVTSVRFAGSPAAYFSAENDSTIYANPGAAGFGEVKVNLLWAQRRLCRFHQYRLLL